MVTNNSSNNTMNLSGSLSQNRVINGDFQVWQRGAGGSAVIAVGASTTAYTTDRWQLLTNANQASTVTQTAGATSGSFLAAVQRNNGQTGTGVMRFCTSLTRDMSVGAAGNYITVSFKARSGADFSPASGNITVTVYSGTGTSDVSGINGAFTGSATPISQTQAITSTLTNYTFTSAAVLGATVTQLAVEFSWTPVGTAGAADTLLITDVQLEVNTAQTPFQRLSFADTLAKCQTFYYKTFFYSTAPATNTGVQTGEVSAMAAGVGTAGQWFSMAYPVSSRLLLPTVTFYNPAANNAQVRDVTAAADCSGTTFWSKGNSLLTIFTQGNASTAVGNLLSVHLTADSELT